MKRRDFIAQCSMAFVATAWMPGRLLWDMPVSNKIPRWRGFNLLDFFSPDPMHRVQHTTAEHLKWMRDWGFDFIRLPIAYPYYLQIDRTKNIAAEDVYHINQQAVEEIVQLVDKANQYGLHVSVNLHRAPGYCINAGFHEPFNLWTDKAAQDAFYFHWNMWAKQFKHKSADQVSFDLINEPAMRQDMNDQHSPASAVPGALYRKIIVGATQAIWKENPNRIVLADGNDVGNDIIPEIEDLPVAQSCRGYYPHAISHYKAPWANKDPEHMPVPVWPGRIGNQYFDRRSLEKYYQPWIELVQKGIGVHCGECGCWNKTPHPVFLSWFHDVLDILTQAGIGYALWNFIGDFGVLDSGRVDVQYEDWYGHQLDRQLLNLLMKY
ncbi:MAG: cellulase family glycosylhydrolase [Thermoflavifilum sp.]|uniref:glycoside hydrolase family 5 protein n=1 Tax=Thermoflavifilum sp. TaxID=1968839 RepID=UPI0018A5D5B0|nr:cellulase family glycosylhydrolase [Thermoflavifilum sp.]QOR75661.1 MAG: cellulase family glycosylhydrolase [Thermoflavifilum sp.]